MWLTYHDVMRNGPPIMKRTLILVIAAACGGNQRTEPAPPVAPQVAEPPAPEPSFEQRMNDYGSIMHAYWPAKPSARRMTEVCDNITTITDAGNAFGMALRTRPNGGIGTLGAAIQIERSVSDLADTCAAADRDAFDKALLKTESFYEKIAGLFAPRESVR